MVLGQVGITGSWLQFQDHSCQDPNPKAFGGFSHHLGSGIPMPRSFLMSQSGPKVSHFRCHQGLQRNHSQPVPVPENMLILSHQCPPPPAATKLHVFQPHPSPMPASKELGTSPVTLCYPVLPSWFSYSNRGKQHFKVLRKSPLPTLPYFRVIHLLATSQPRHLTRDRIRGPFLLLKKSPKPSQLPRLLFLTSSPLLCSWKNRSPIYPFSGLP